VTTALKLRRFIIFSSAIVLLTPWLTSYAYGISHDVSGHEIVHVEAAESPTLPSATLFGKAIGGVTPGDLFYIDATSNTHDITVALYLTNAYELTPYLRYLILEVGVYFEGDDGQWQKAPLRNGDPFPDTFVTLRNSPVSLILAGYTKYKITIDSGSFYCTTANTKENPTLPHFYLTAEEM
jgi:hypothetical protein